MNNNVPIRVIKRASGTKCYFFFIFICNDPVTIPFYFINPSFFCKRLAYQCTKHRTNGSGIGALLPFLINGLTHIFYCIRAFLLYAGLWLCHSLSGLGCNLFQRFFRKYRFIFCCYIFCCCIFIF